MVRDICPSNVRPVDMLGQCRVDMLLYLSVKNPVPMALTMSDLTFDVYFDDSDGALCFIRCVLEPLRDIHWSHSDHSGERWELAPQGLTRIALELDGVNDQGDGPDQCIRLASEFMGGTLHVSVRNGRMQVHLGKFVALVEFQMDDMPAKRGGKCG